MRTVIVTDLSAPKLYLNGDAKMTIEAGSDYFDFGAYADDNFDNIVKLSAPSYIHYTDENGTLSKVDKVDTTKLGTYKIVYEYTDNHGNVGVDANRTDHEYVMRTVIVKSSQPKNNAPVLDGVETNG